MKKINHIKMKKFVIYAKKIILVIKTSGIIEITLENIEGAAHDICNLKYKTPKEIPVVFIMVLHMVITS